MTIQQLKQNIESNTISSNVLIFKVPSFPNFLVNQYIEAIAQSKNQTIEYIESLNPLFQENDSIFFEETIDNNQNLRVYKVDEYIPDSLKILDLTNLIIVTTKIKETDYMISLNPYIVDIPKLENWQIQDYVYSVCEGVPESELEWLVKLCNFDIYRLSVECSKLSIFKPEERRYLFDQLKYDGFISDLTSFGIFNFTTAILNKDYNALFKMYNEIDRIDINEFGLTKILIQNFRNLISVQLNSNPTPENTGLSSKQLWAIKRIPRLFSPDQLITILQFLLDIDRQVKTGELPVEIMRDYILIKILSL